LFTGTIGKSFTPKAQDTFGMYLDQAFSIFVDTMVKLLLKTMEELQGLCFIQVVHNMWTSAGNNNILGLCLCFVMSNFDRQIIPIFLIVNNTSQGAQFHADALRTINQQERFKVNLADCTHLISSDHTMVAARSVSNYSDGSEQVDCPHPVSNQI
jgi:hypothetical protein